LHNHTPTSLSNTIINSLESVGGCKRVNSCINENQGTFLSEVEMDHTPLKRKKLDDTLSTTWMENEQSSSIYDLLECHENVSQGKPVLQIKQPRMDDIVKSCFKQLMPHRINPFYLETNHKEIDQRMVLIMMDWMMQVCYDFNFQRSTFHYAINYVHSYLANTHGISRRQLQLMGLASLLIAAKLEEIFAPKLKEFAKLIEDEYSTKEIQDMEQHITKALQWKLTPATSFFWVHLLMNQWNTYYTDTKFKEEYNEQLYQLVDAYSICVGHLQYDKRVLVVSALYILLSICYGNYSIIEVLEVFTSSSRFLIESNWLNNTFKDFLSKTFEFSLEDLLPGIQYVAQFVDMPFEYTIPTVLQMNREYLCTLQTYSGEQVSYFDKKWFKLR